MRRSYQRGRAYWLGLAPMIGTVLVACGDTSTQTSTSANVAGIFAGTVTFSAASCTPMFRPGFHRNGYTDRRVFDLTQAAASLSGVDHLYPDVQVSGSVSGQRIALKEHLEWSDAGGTVKMDADYDLRLES